MSYSGEAEQVVRISLNGAEVAAKLTGAAAKNIAVMLYAVLKDQHRTKGKMRLSHMLRSGKELKVFAVKDGDLKKFCEAAKKYGVLYCVLKDKNAKDGISDVMVRAEDASKINRIMERFQLSTVDRASVKATVVREKRGKEGQKAEQPPAPEKTAPKRDELDDLLDQLMKKEPAKEAVIHENPTGARRTESGPSVPSLMTAEKARSRMSVREELARIRAEQQKQKQSTKPVQQHKAPKKKKRKER